MKKTWKMTAAALALVTLLAGCSSAGTTGNGSSTDNAGSTNNTSSTDNTGMSGEITVVSREDGSGTRGAFIELFGIQEKDSNGNKVDNTTDEAIITQSTAAMITTVGGDKNAIGYISLGSLNDTVKALKIDGSEATVENVKSGAYQVSRPFNMVTKGDTTNALAQDFINFALSADGQKVVEENKYIPLDNAPAFASTKPSGKITVGGSSSVTPVMEKLIEAYKKVNAAATIELQTHDSTVGVTSTLEGTFDIGMASRELKEEEISQGAKPILLATDGVAVIVNNQNSLDDLSKEQVKNIFTAAVTDWAEIG